MCVLTNLLSKGQSHKILVHDSNGCAMDESRLSDLHTPLHLCSAQGHLLCCQLLVSRGANMALRDGTTEG